VCRSDAEMPSSLEIEARYGAHQTFCVNCKRPFSLRHAVVHFGQTAVFIDQENHVVHGVAQLGLAGSQGLALLLGQAAELGSSQFLRGTHEAHGDDAGQKESQERGQNGPSLTIAEHESTED
jgi:hypothetical protein